MRATGRQRDPALLHPVCTVTAPEICKLRQRRRGAGRTILKREERILSLIVIDCTKIEAHTPLDLSWSVGGCVCDPCHSEHEGQYMDERAGMSDRDLKNPPFCVTINVQACAIRCTGANREWAGARDKRDWRSILSGIFPRRERSDRVFGPIYTSGRLRVRAPSTRSVFPFHSERPARASVLRHRPSSPPG